MHLRRLAMASLSILAMTSPRMSHPCLLWNASPSVPVGLYWLTSRPPGTGELAVIRLPEPIRSLAAARSYLGIGAFLIKPVAAGAGDLVCRHGATVTINGRLVAEARTTDASGRHLPSWSGCSVLAANQVLLLSAPADSFDGRYFGPIDRGQVIGAVQPLWVNNISGRPRTTPHQRGPP
jgi:conjugative transfer signal peptidase TraF